MKKAKTKPTVYGKPVYDPLLEYLEKQLEIPKTAIKVGAYLFDKLARAKMDESGMRTTDIYLSDEVIELMKKADPEVWHHRYWSYVPDEDLTLQSDVRFPDFRFTEKAWLDRNINRILGGKEFSEEEAMAVIKEFVPVSDFYGFNRIPPVILVWRMLDLFDEIQKNPKSILKTRHVPEEMLLIYQGIEPATSTYLEQYDLPATEQARKDCKAGLLERAIDWQEAAELFPLAETDKLDFPSTKSLLKKLTPPAPSATKRAIKTVTKTTKSKTSKTKPAKSSYVYGIRQYNPEDWSLVATYTPVNSIYGELNVDPDEVGFSVDVPKLIDGLVTVKERMDQEPNGSRYQFWYRYCKLQYGDSDVY